jgi:hypothetical protein
MPLERSGSLGRSQATTPALKIAQKPSGERKQATAATLAWMVGKLKSPVDLTVPAEGYFRALGQILPIEVLAELPLRFCPTTAQELESLKVRILEFADGLTAVAAFDGAPMIEAPAEKPAQPDLIGKPTVTGVLERVSEKKGTSRRGPWTCYGVKVGDSWFNTFSQTIGAEAKALAGKRVTITYETNPKGNTIVEITPT